MARFQTAVIFFTVDGLSRWGEEHEDETDTRCMVTEWKEATTPSGHNHSSEFLSLSLSTQGKNSGLTPISHPSISSLLTPTFPVCFVQNRSHRCQHTRSRSAHTAERSRSLVPFDFKTTSQCLIQPCRRGEPQHAPLFIARKNCGSCEILAGTRDETLSQSQQNQENGLALELVRLEKKK